VRDIGIRDKKRWGVRTSYALNAIMHWNEKRDRHVDASRQVYAIDGWWSWFGNLNAQWVALGGSGDPLVTPHWEGTMVGWRHTFEYAANAVFLDGHVTRLVPNLGGLRMPSSPDNPDRTVDTTKYFTWLPGERTTRFDFDPYRGEIEEFEGRSPYYLQNPEDPDGTHGHTPAGFPLEDLSVSYKTRFNLWREYGNEARERD
jgi:prepilin-type processing-associated H-X9-DG protein